MSRTNIAAIVGMLGGLLLLFGGGGGIGPIQPGDVLTECYRSDRLSKVSTLLEMAGRDFKSDDEQADWWNDKVQAARVKDFQPFIDAVAEAIEGGTVVEFAEQLEAAL